MKDIIFDIETAKTIGEVGGDLSKIGVTVVGIYEYINDTFTAYEEGEFNKLEEVLRGAERIIGFNSKHFDVPALAPQLSFNLHEIPHLDLMEDVELNAGFRIGLDDLASVTLGTSKSGTGLDAIRWWKEGEKQKVKDYCLQDVKVTRDLFEYGKHYGKIYFQDKKTKQRRELPVSWSEKLMDMESAIKYAFEKRLAIDITYRVKNGFRETTEKSRVDVEEIRQDGFAGFCHGTRVRKVFPFADIVKVDVTDVSYQIEKDVQQTLI